MQPTKLARAWKPSILLTLSAGLLCLATPEARAQDLFVSNTGNGTIRRISPTGANLGDFATGLAGVRGLAFDAAGNLYAATVADPNQIRRFSPTGVDLGVFASTGLANPFGLAFDSVGNLYAANSSGNTIRRFSPTGADLGTFATLANLSSPNDLAFDAAGNLYVSHYGSFSVRRFSPTGADLGNFATAGGGSNLTIVRGLALDGVGNLYVANNNQIERFSPTGASLGIFAQTGLNGSYDIDFGPDGNLYAANSNTGTIRRFSPTGADLGDFATGLPDPLYLAFSPTLGAAAAPEPATLALLVLGSLAGGIIVRRRKA